MLTWKPAVARRLPKWYGLRNMTLPCLHRRLLRSRISLQHRRALASIVTDILHLRVRLKVFEAHSLVKDSRDHLAGTTLTIRGCGGWILARRYSML